jgi:hypothetical protein
MKYFLIIGLLFLSKCQILAQNNEEAVRKIRKEVVRIQSNIASFESISIHLFDESSQGAEAVAYYKENEMKLLEVVWFGETGKHQIMYFLREQAPFYVLDKKYRYNRPIYWDETTAKEAGDTAFFNPKQTFVSSNRYYFKSGELFLGLNENDELLDQFVNDTTLVEEVLLEDFHRIKLRFEE